MADRPRREAHTPKRLGDEDFPSGSSPRNTKRPKLDTPKTPDRPRLRESQTAPETPDPSGPKKTVEEWLSCYNKWRQMRADLSSDRMRQALQAQGVDLSYVDGLLCKSLRPKDTLPDNDPSPTRSPIPPSSPSLESEPDPDAGDSTPSEGSNTPDDDRDNCSTNFKDPTQVDLPDLTPLADIRSRLHIIQVLSTRLGGARRATVDQRMRMVAFAESFKQIEKSFFEIAPSLSLWFSSDGVTSYCHIYKVMLHWYQQSIPYGPDTMRRILDHLDRIGKLESDVQALGRDIRCFGMDETLTSDERSMSMMNRRGNFIQYSLSEELKMVNLDAEGLGDFELLSEIERFHSESPMMEDREVDELLDTFFREE